jgi:excinuclease ABC subunit C
MQKANFGKLNMPDKPGVYFFMKGKDILYIGKATSLKDRVKSYFSSDLIETRGPLLVDMVFKSDSIKWTETDSVLEALILEANLIKKNQPYYNTKEKDDKSFNYVCITKDELGP